MKKPTFTLTRKDPEMLDLIAKTDKKTLAIWAIECTERVMPYFEKERPDDPRPRHAINTLKTWLATGEFHMSIIRKASLDAHKAAKDCKEGSPAQSAAHAAGQCVATAHVARHAYGPAIYAQQAIFRASDSMDEVMKERDWQYQRLRGLLE